MVVVDVVSFFRVLAVDVVAGVVLFVAAVLFVVAVFVVIAFGDVIFSFLVLLSEVV